MSGVYLILCVPTQKVYVGSTIHSFWRRFAQHKGTLRNQRKGPTRLQRAWDKYGEAAFKFMPLTVCQAEEVRELEQVLIDSLQPELNTQKSAINSLYRPLHDAVRRKAASERTKAAWSSGAFKHRSRRCKRWLVRGESLTRQEICVKYDIKMPALQERIRKGLRGDALIQPPQFHAQRFLVRGEMLRISEIAERYGLGRATVLYRVKGGATGEALVKPSRQGDSRETQRSVRHPPK